MDPISIALLGGTALASIFGANQQADAAKQAAAVQAQTAKENKALAEKTTALSLGDLDTALGKALGTFQEGQAAATAPLAPYAQAGAGALGRLSDAYGVNGPEGNARASAAFTTSPGYQFGLSQGVQALDRSANARGGLYGGSTLKALTEYGQNYGMQQGWQPYLSGLSGLAGAGQQAATGLSGLTADMYGSRANALLGNGNARAGVRGQGLAAITDASSQGGAAQAGGIVNQSNAWTGGLNNLALLAGNYAGARRPGAPLANPFGF